MKLHAITPTFGTLVEGLDLARMTSPMARGLHALWEQRHLLVLRGGRTDRAVLEGLAAQLGEVDGMGEIREAETPWNAELSAAHRPPFACALRCEQAPAAGGATWFACLPAALRSMAPDLAARLRWLTLQHGSSLHPLVLTQPETGEPTLYLGARRNARIDGLPHAESERLLNIVWSYATAASVTLCHRWQAGDVVLWNNLTVAHRHDPVPAGSARVLQGVRVRGRSALVTPIQREAA